MGQRIGEICFYQENLEKLFLNDVPLVDLRSPKEFESGSIPGAINLPLMSNDERHQVGLCYKEQGQDKAIELGHKLVSKDIKQERMDKWISFIKENPNCIFFCFRGGLRSQTVQKWLQEEDLNIPIIDGGYKKLRNFLLDKIECLTNGLDFLVLSGNTGARKTEIINNMSADYSTLDLEGLANHRGSAFGYNITPQPTQIDFENRLASRMIKIANNPKSKEVIIEDESQRIGRIGIPKIFFEKKKMSPVYLLDIDLKTRTRNTCELYVENLWRENFEQTKDYDEFKEIFSAPMNRIVKRLGRQTLVLCLELLDQAISHQREHNDFSKHYMWIEILLEKYYDPLYEKGLNSKEVIAKGDDEDFKTWCKDNLTL